MVDRTSALRAALRWGGGSILIAALALLPIDARACSVCIGWTGGEGLNGGFYWSALLLTMLPFAVVAAVGAWVGYAIRRSRAREADSDPRPAAQRSILRR